MMEKTHTVQIIKKARPPILISDKVDFRTGKTTRDKDRHFMMTKGQFTKKMRY